MEERLYGSEWKHNETRYRLRYRANLSEEKALHWVMQSEEDPMDVRIVSESELVCQNVNGAYWEPVSRPAVDGETPVHHLGTLQLETKRLQLRPFDVSDARPVFENYASDMESCKYLSWNPHQDIAETERILRSRIVHYQDPQYYEWSILQKDSGIGPIGYIRGIIVSDEADTVDIEFCIGKRWRNQGLASESLRAVFEFFFDRVGMYRVTAAYDVMNKYAGAVLRGCGMRFESIEMSAAVYHQTRRHLRGYGLIREEFCKRNQPLIPNESCACANARCEWHGNCAACRLFHIQLSRIPQSYCIRTGRKSRFEMKAPL